ncbi:MAG: MFS transporter [Nitrososphaerota archaeon]|nr:MFS transporter [Nitrososphaerota archaeon]
MPDRREAESLPYIYLLVILISETFALRASTNMQYTTVPLVASEVYYMGMTTVGAIYAVNSLATSITTLFINSKLRSSTRRVVFILSSFMYALSFPFITISGEIGLWIFSALTGVLLGLISTNIVNAAGIIGRTPREREKGIAVYTVSLSASLVAGPLVESFILSYVSLPVSFGYFAIFPATSAVLSLFLPFPEENTATKSTNAGVFKPFRKIGFRTAVYNNAMYSIPFAGIVVFGGLYSINYLNVSNSSAELYFAIFFAVSFASRLYFSIKPPQDLKAASLLSAISTFIGLILMVAIISPWSYALAICLLGLPHGLTYPISLLYIFRTSEEHERNSMNSIFSSLMVGLNIIVPLVMGSVSETVGLRNTFGMLLIPVSVLAYLLIRNIRKQ